MADNMLIPTSEPISKNPNWKVYSVKEGKKISEYILDANWMTNRLQEPKDKWWDINIYKDSSLGKKGNKIIKVREPSKKELSSFYYVPDNSYEPVFLDKKTPGAKYMSSLYNIKSASDTSYVFLKPAKDIGIRCRQNSEPVNDISNTFYLNDEQKQRFLQDYRRFMESSDNPQIFFKKLYSKTLAPLLKEHRAETEKKINPQNLQFDYIIRNRGESSIIIQDKNYETIRNFSGMKNENALKIIEASFQGKILAYSEKDEPARIYGSFPGVVFDRAKEEYAEHVRSFIGNSLIEGKSVLLNNNNEINYSFDAEKGKVLTGLQQLYFQQIRHEKGFKSPYFISSSERLDIKPGQMGIVLGTYDPGKKNLTYKYYYNFNQLFNIQLNHEHVLPAVAVNVKETENNNLSNNLLKTNASEKTSPDKLYKLIFEDSVKNYLSSVFTGKTYTPSPHLTLYGKEIGKCINKNKFSVFKSVQDAYNSISSIKSTKDNNIFLEEKEQRQRTQSHKKGRNR